MPRLRSVLVLLLLLALLAPAAETLRSLTILHTNDLHARLSPDQEGRGGFAHLATLIRRERAATDACLLVDAGDFVQGSPVSTLYQGLPIFEIVNRFGYDAATLGNHDFDYGWQMIPKYLRTARFPIVSANVADAGGRLLTGRAYVIRSVKGIRVALIGVIMGNLLSYSTPERMGPWRALPVVETVRKYAAEVRDRADLVVVLAHLELAEQPELLQGVPEAEVIIAGHVHGALESALEKDGRLLVRSASYGRELGRLDLKLDLPARKIAAWSWKRIPVDSRAIPADRDVAAQVAKWDARVAKMVDVPIGEARREVATLNLKSLIEEAMREATGADFAYMNPGGIRDRLRAGRLLARDVWNLMPFDNTAVVGRFKGAQLPAQVTAGRAVDPAREYTLAVNDFTAANQRTQLGSTGLTFTDTGKLLRDVIIQHIRKRGVIE
jgi:2',3'-cyclic-nucleotide 2'-phosphodiesterase (5'-nucleotidase family)